MSATDWMIPRVSLSAEAYLQSTLVSLDTYGTAQPEETVRLAKALAQQNTVQQAIIKQAVARVAELELELILLEPRPRSIRPWWRFWRRAS